MAEAAKEEKNSHCRLLKTKYNYENISQQLTFGKGNDIYLRNNLKKLNNAT